MTLSQQRRIAKSLSNHEIVEFPKRNHTIEHTFRWFILGLVFCWIGALANRVENLFSEKRIVWLFYIQGALVPLQGFINSIIYGFNDEIRSKVLATCWSKKKTDVFSIQDEYTRLLQAENENIYWETVSQSSDVSFDWKFDSVITCSVFFFFVVFFKKKMWLGLCDEAFLFFVVFFFKNVFLDFWATRASVSNKYIYLVL